MRDTSAVIADVVQGQAFAGVEADQNLPAVPGDPMSVELE